MNYDINIILSYLKKSNPEIELVYFNRYPTQQILEVEKVKNTYGRRQIEKALEIREKFGFSFWESLLSTFNVDINCDYSFFKDVLKHNKIENSIPFNIDDNSSINSFLLESKDVNIAILSKCQTNKGIFHIPFIDFHIKPGAINLKTVEMLVTRLEYGKGFIINSGKSYHFFGTQLESIELHINRLIKLILFSPIVDRNWVVHQLLEKMSSLRVNIGKKQKMNIVKYI